MSVRFFIGRSGTGKSYAIEQEIIKKLKAEPNGPPIIYLVPDQMTFEAEYQIASTPGLEGMTRLHVLSFSRLALRILQEVGGSTRLHINNIGVSMLLRRILANRKKDLKVFRRASGQRGFVDQLMQTIAEFKQYCLTSEYLKERWDAIGEGGHPDETMTSEKLHDLQLIYHDFEQALTHRFLDSEDYLRLTVERIHQSKWVEDAEIWVDGFDSFLPQELEVLKELMLSTKQQTFALTMDRVYDHLPHEMNTFRKTAWTFQTLQQLASEMEVSQKEPALFSTPMRFEYRSLRHLEKNYDTRPAPSGVNDGAINLSEVVNRREEVEQTARDIINLVRDEGYRYRDIAVMVRDLSGYDEMIDTIFEDYEIPVFIDQKRPMRHHPLVEFIRSSLDVVQLHWRYESLFRCVKTDLLFPLDADLESEREAADQLENYVLAFGIHGTHWHQDQPWQYRQYRGLSEEDVTQSDDEKKIERELNYTRRKLAAPLLQFEAELKQAESVKGRCTVIFRFLERLQIPEKMEQLRDLAEDQGRLDEAREHDQVWRAVLDCLDQMVETGAEEKMSMETFSSVLDSGLDELKFALVPPSLDQVIAGSVDRTRLSNVRAVFVMGVNEGIMPLKIDDEGLLSDEDREILDDYGTAIGETSREALLAEEAFIYKTFSSPSEKLYISYPLATEDGQALMPSPVINRIKQLFPDLKTRLVAGEAHEHETAEQLDWLNNRNKALSTSAAEIRYFQRGYPIADLWWDVYDWLIQHSPTSEKTKQVFSSLFDRNEAKRLDADVAQSLYGTHIKASVSRMELFQSCPFAQFASYGLKLKERDSYKLEAPDIGQLFHAAMKQMTEALIKANKEWSDVDDEECEQLASSTVKGLSPRLQKQILQSSAKHRYLQHKLTQVVIQAAKVLKRQSQISGFSPVGLELPFGTGQSLPPLVFSLPGGGQMEIIGRIDRVDKGYDERGLLLRIIDYKSGVSDLNLNDVFYGLALQMLTYLDVVLTHSEKWLGEVANPAGVLYFHVHNPMLNESQETTDEELEEKLLKQFKMKGLLLEDEEIVRLMDQSLGTGHSDLLPVAVKKNGDFYSTSKVVDDENMSVLRHYIRGLIQQIGTNITQGQIDIAPYKKNNRTPCEFCSFKPVCQFDKARPENEYRHIKMDDNETIINRIREGEDQNGK